MGSWESKLVKRLRSIDDAVRNQAVQELLNHRDLPTLMDEKIIPILTDQLKYWNPSSPEQYWTTFAAGAQRALEAVADIVTKNPAVRRKLQESVAKYDPVTDRYRLALMGIKNELFYNSYQLAMEGLQEVNKNENCKQGTREFKFLHDQARQLQPRFKRILKKIASSKRLDELHVWTPPPLFATTNVAAEDKLAKLKQGSRVIEKAVARRGHKNNQPLDASHVCDILRGSIICNDAYSMARVVDNLRFMASEKNKDLDLQIDIVRIKDRFEDPTEDNYADCLVNIRFKDHTQDGHVAEVQLHHRDIHNIKASGHTSYSAKRLKRDILEATKPAMQRVATAIFSVAQKVLQFALRPYMETTSTPEPPFDPLHLVQLYK